MKKRLILVVTLLLCIFLLGGCNEKEKFAKAHAEVMQLTKQASEVKVEKVEEKKRSIFELPSMEEIQKKDDAIAAAEQKHQEIIDQINSKIKEMAEYAESEPALAPQLEGIKADVEKKDKKWKSGVAESKAINDMTRQLKEAEIQKQGKK